MVLDQFGWQRSNLYRAGFHCRSGKQTRPLGVSDSSAQRGLPVESRRRAQLFLDAQQLIVFRDAVRAAR